MQLQTQSLLFVWVLTQLGKCDASCYQPDANRAPSLWRYQDCSIMTQHLGVR